MKLKFPWQKVQMIRACIDLTDMRLWELYDNMDFFVVQTPLEDPVVASIMGAGGQEYGLSVFRGPNAFQQPHLLSDGPKASADKINTIGFSMMYYRDMDYIEKKWLKSCNYKARKDDRVPLVIFKKPGRMVEMVEKDNDLKLMLYILKGIIKAQEEGLFHPKTIGVSGSKIMTIEVSGDTLKPDVRITRKSFPGSKELLQLCNDDSMFEEVPLPQDLAGLPKLDETWVIVPVYISKENSEKDDCILIISEEKSYYILHADVLAMDVLDAMKILCSVFSGDNAAESVGVPKKIIIAEKEFFNAAKGYLQQWGIDVRYKKNHHVAEDVRESLQKDFPAFIEKHVVKNLVMPDIDLSVVPDDDDLQNWKTVQKALTNQFINFWHNADKLRKNRPSKQFFGDTDWEYYIDEYGDIMALPTYVNWAALSYRAGKNQPTFAEKLLAGDLPQALRISLEALNRAHPSLYQIVETDHETGNIVLKDLLLPKTITAHDHGLSQTAKPGWIVPFRVYSVGNFHFVDIAGPIFNPFDATEVIEKLQESSLPTEPSSRWLRENAYIFGRLWPLYDDIQDRNSMPPKLVNTDDEPLEFIAAYFEYNNRKKVTRALRQRDDIDYDQDRDEYAWFKINPDDVLMPTTLLARIFFEDNKIKAELNSRGRLNSLRRFLEAIEGVHYLNCETKDVQDILDEAPENKDIVEEPIPEEVFSVVQDRMNKYYMDWLDKPIPAFDNKTPRRAVKTKKGAQKVRIMIETIPSPADKRDIKIPKKEMLEELGLAEK